MPFAQFPICSEFKLQNPNFNLNNTLKINSMFYIFLYLSKDNKLWGTGSPFTANLILGAYSSAATMPWGDIGFMLSFQSAFGEQLSSFRDFKQCFSFLLRALLGDTSAKIVYKTQPIVGSMLSSTRALAR